jgi:CHAT domain-containing protein
VARYYTEGAVAFGHGEATRDGLLHALVDAPSTVISCHATQDLEDGAGLVLTDGILRSDELERLPHRSRGVAVLNACSTGQVSLTHPDEAIGLPNALLHAGFKGVCATIWPVSDFVAFVAIARMQQQIHANPSVPSHHLLSDTRTWLRTSTTQDFNLWFSQLGAEVNLDEHVIALGLDWLMQYGESATPFDDPASWAAFYYLGR